MPKTDTSDIQTNFNPFMLWNNSKNLKSDISLWKIKDAWYIKSFSNLNRLKNLWKSGLGDTAIRY